MLQYFKFREKRRRPSLSVTRTPRLLLGGITPGEQETLAEAFGLTDEPPCPEIRSLGAVDANEFDQIWKSAGEALVIADALSARIIDVNPQAVRLMGLPRAVLLQMTQTELHPLREREQAAENFFISSPRARECHVVHASGELVPVDVTTPESMQLSGRRVVISSLHPTRGRARREERLLRINRALSAVYEATRRHGQAASERELNVTTCAAMVGAGLLACWIGGTSEDGDDPIIVLASAGAAGPAGERTLYWRLDRDDGEPTAMAIAEGRYQMVAHLERNSARQLWKHVASAHGIGAVLSVPLFDRGRPVAAITLCTTDTAEFIGEELGLFQQFAETHMAAVARFRAASR